ncbi:AAA family ATPase [Chryseolinea sp. T2]|uniref:AAA family ATPase n=1 Tax=Chryseolinea sp. T2 TaxID=3129255 RepID=UPI0030774D3D
MVRGLVIGKFMPVHKGHIALVECACSHCDEVIVSMSYTPHDPIPGDVRFDWVRKSLAHLPKAKSFKVLDDFDDETLPLEDRTKIWSDFIRRTYPVVDVVVSSEEYGEPFAYHLGAKHLLFDSDRKRIPVSATMIRSKPLTYWNFIAEPARYYFVKKICVYGAESTGKSTLTIRLAERFNTSFVPEVAREMLISNDFNVNDIIEIGKAHDKRVEEKTREANRLLFCDTDVITTQIYSKHYLGVVPQILLELEEKTSYALYFLLDVDVPWVADGLRDLGDRREEMMELFRTALTERNIPFVAIRGDFAAREASMVAVVNDVLARY